MLTRRSRGREFLQRVCPMGQLAPARRTEAKSLSSDSRCASARRTRASNPRTLKIAGSVRPSAMTASAGIDVPAAGLFQARAEEEGLGIGIQSVTAAQVIGGFGG